MRPPLSILLVGFDEDDQIILAYCFKLLKAPVSLLAIPVTAMLPAYLQSGTGQPDLIIIGVDSLKAETFDVLESMKEASKQLPILLMSTWHEKKDLIRANHVGIKEIFSNPVQLNDLSTMLSKLVADYQRHSVYRLSDK